MLEEMGEMKVKSETTVVAAHFRRVLQLETCQRGEHDQSCAHSLSRVFRVVWAVPVDDDNTSVRGVQ
jgi:hypothetical protein